MKVLKKKLLFFVALDFLQEKWNFNHIFQSTVKIHHTSHMILVNVNLPLFDSDSHKSHSCNSNNFTSSPNVHFKSTSMGIIRSCFSFIAGTVCGVFFWRWFSQGPFLEQQQFHFLAKRAPQIKIDGYNKKLLLFHSRDSLWGICCSELSSSKYSEASWHSHLYGQDHRGEIPQAQEAGWWWRLRLDFTPLIFNQVLVLEFYFILDHVESYISLSTKNLEATKFWKSGDENVNKVSISNKHFGFPCLACFEIDIELPVKAV